MQLSIIMPVYNVVSFVGTCIQSIMRDSAAEDLFEVIIVNDGSTDQSMSVVRKICAGHENIHILEQSNQGLSAARMNGMKVAQGEYVWFVDSDDWIEKDAISRILSILERIEPDVLVTPLHWRYKDGRRDFFDITLIDDKQYLGKDYLAEARLPVWAAQRYIIKKGFLNNNTWINFPLNTLHEDEYFGRVLLYSAHSVYVLRYALYNYRQRENSIMSSLSIKNAYDLVKIHKLLISFLESKVLDNDKHWFRRTIFKDVLIVSYYRSKSFFPKKDFHRFIFNNRKYIIQEYFLTKPQKSFKKKFGDFFFLYSPYFFSRCKGVRYIE